MTDTETEFAAFIQHLRQQGHNDFCRLLAHMGREDVPEQYRASWDFWASLSGRSRNLMLDVACGRRTRKRS
jgi:hypothetical protein